MLRIRITPAVLPVACALFLFGAAAVPAWSWGPMGHRIVAKIAEQRLHPQARMRFRLLAGKGATLDSVANWADEIREARPETAPWHYINIAPGSKELDLKRDCPGGDCITAKAREFQGLVRLAMKKQEKRLDALRFLVHLMGDLHQPLHAGFASDRGGNGIRVIVAGEESTLHAYWDSKLLDENVEDEDALVAELLAGISLADEKECRRGHLTDWTWESAQLASEVAYGALPDGEPKTLDGEYAQQAWETAKQQLTKGGVRLAAILNEMWGY
ncbi:MAG: S1/P1 nuclease [Acidobacteria bacterium]|nr:S1/P1 nuclease [Acidobacteriota bacterium]